MTPSLQAPSLQAPSLLSVQPAKFFGHNDTPFSPLILADRLISLAQEADRAGLTSSASRLVGLVYAVLDDESGQAAHAT